MIDPKNMMKVGTYKKIIVSVLKSGAHPKRLAMSMAAGVTLGIFPMLGVTTAACAVVALSFRLNLPVIQLVNYIVYPLQIALLLPFYKFGNVIFAPQQTVNIDALKELLLSGRLMQVMTTLAEATIHAAGAWLLISPVVFVTVQLGLRPVLLRFKNP